MNYMFDVEKIAEVIKDMAKITGKSYDAVWKYYTHDYIKEKTTWKEVKKYLK